jgi:serralysin
MCSICDRLGLDSHSVHAVELANDYNLDPYAGLGYTFRGKQIADHERVISQIDSGWSQDTSDGVITYGFADHVHALGLNNNPSFGEGSGYSPFSEAQKEAARIAIGAWDDLIAPSFVEVEQGPGASDFGRQTTDIMLANTTTGPAQAWAYYPGYGNQYQRVAGDAWIADPSVNWTNEWFTPGGYGNTTLIHELGHSIGLSHPGSYNGAGATTYLDQAEYAQDSMQYSIMSYWDGGQTGASTVNWTLFLNNYAQTPMLHDILTIQAKYGADPTTRTGDNSYGFNNDTGKDVFDFEKNPYPYLAIYDAGGVDTLDLSGFTASQFVNLAPGSFSSVGAAIPSFEEINAARASEGFAPITEATYSAVVNSRNASVESKIASDTGVTGVVASGYDNLSIAYNTVIENAVGGSARDVLWGNHVANRLEGRDGDDVIKGFEGDDTLVGGAGADQLFGGTGNDLFIFAEQESGDVIMDWNSGDKIDLTAFGDLTFVGDAAFSGSGQVRYQEGILSADFDGDGAADFSVAVASSPPLTSADLFMI